MVQGRKVALGLRDLQRVRRIAERQVDRGL